MTEWWHALRFEQQIFYTIAILATIVLLGQLLLSLIGADHGLDLDVSTDHGSGLGILSVQSVTTFFVGFGWVGVLWLNRGFGLLVAVVSGTVVGVATMAAMILLMRSLLRLQDSGTLDYRNAIGLLGTVYCVIPAARGAGGQVEVLFQGRTVFADAVTDSQQAIATGAQVRVVSVLEPATLIVEPA